MNKFKRMIILLLILITATGCSNNSIINLHDYSHKDPPQFQEEDWILEFILKGDSYYGD